MWRFTVSERPARERLNRNETRLTPSLLLLLIVSLQKRQQLSGDCLHPQRIQMKRIKKILTFVCSREPLAIVEQNYFVSNSPPHI